jgi:DNA replication protein DnaC
MPDNVFRKDKGFKLTYESDGVYLTVFKPLDFFERASENEVLNTIRRKKNSRIQRLLRNASLGLDACMEDIDYTVDRTIDKKTVKTLSTCSFIEQKLNIVISGKTGSGKTYIACAIGNATCRNGYSVKYFRVPELLLEIQEAKNENKYLKFMTSLQNIKLLILDDLDQYIHI